MPTATAWRPETVAVGTARQSSTGALWSPSYTAAPTVTISRLRHLSISGHALLTEDPEENREYVLMDRTKKIWCLWPAFG